MKPTNVSPFVLEHLIVDPTFKAGGQGSFYPISGVLWYLATTCTPIHSCTNSTAVVKTAFATSMLLLPMPSPPSFLGRSDLWIDP